MGILQQVGTRRGSQTMQGYQPMTAGVQLLQSNVQDDFQIGFDELKSTEQPYLAY